MQDHDSDLFAEFVSPGAEHMIAFHAIFEGMLDAGFTEDQALTLLGVTFARLCVENSE
jgi:hypothetical protein